MGNFCSGVWEKLKSSLHPNSLFTYSTVKIVQIRDWRVGLIHRFVQLFIFAYVIGYVIVWNQNYLSRESSYGTATTKVLGRSLGINAFGEERFVDSSDLVYPASEPGALFVATKYALTSEQKVDYCPRNTITRCDRDEECAAGSSGMKFRCNNKQCQYYQWCPEEDDVSLPNSITDVVQLLNVNNFTVWVKSQISFPILKPGSVFSTISQPNPVPVTPDFTKGNLFSVDQILSLTKNENTTYDKIRDRGAIIKVTIRWSCNLDRWNPEDSCTIRYSALRMDDSTMNDGNNFRFVSTYKNNGVLNRDLTKFYGVRVFFESIGDGYRISAIQIILQLSSGLAMLALSTLVCDILIQYISPQKEALYARKNDVVYEHEIINGETSSLIRGESFQNKF